MAVDSSAMEKEQVVPMVWRGAFTSIVDAFIQRDYSLALGITCVAPVTIEAAKQIEEYIDDYGEELVKLPSSTWESSVCLWMGEHYDVLIDLWTAGEGRSDLVLSARVKEMGKSFEIIIGMVHVP